QRYAMLHENRVVLRLSDEHARQLIAKGGRTWEPMKGRRSKDKMVVPESIAANARSLRVWVQRAVEYAQWDKGLQCGGRKEPKAKKIIAEAILRDMQGSASEKLALFEKLKARGGFDGEDRRELVKVENMRRTFAAMEKSQ